MPGLVRAEKRRKEGVHVYLPPAEMNRMRKMKAKEGMTYGELIQALMKFYEDNR